MKAKNLKQAQIYTVELDKKRPMTFDFNALCELQETYADPFEALAGLETMNLKAMKVLVHATLVAGAEAKGVEMELSMNQVGNILGQLMLGDQESFQNIFETMSKSIMEFLPEAPEEAETSEAEVEAEGKSKN